ncbi:tryptophan synthase alpha chain [Bacteroidales bacterium]|nr:tryptophan synthase alpha chain [Bacteroidales bacterium]
MNRIKELFKRKQNDILSIYFTAGFPKLEDTCAVIRELQNKGVDLIEVGIPFSDPMADGLVIQESSMQALKNGMNLRILFQQLANIRKDVHIPLIMMGYLNPIMQYGFDTFCKDCKAVGVDGMIIPDLPFKDYLDEYKAIADKYDLRIIMLITPATSDERIRLIDAHTDGFIYMVSSASTTGTQTNFDQEKQSYFKRIKAMKLNNPQLIGFGISNKSTLAAALQNASGAIVGSKFVAILGESKDIKSAVEELLKSLSE